MKKNIPNIFTCLNLLCGVIGIIIVLQYQEYQWAAYLMWIAGLMDFLDGFVARLLKVSSDLGKQLDSLADLITFGLLPAYMAMGMLAQNLPSSWFPYLALILAVAAAWRLAKFNIDTRQTDHFLGVPTPASAIFFSGLPWWFGNSPLSQDATGAILIGLVIIFSWLMISELKIMAFKFKNFSWRSNWPTYLFGLVSIVLLLVLQLKSVSLLVILYLLFSFFDLNPVTDEKNK